MKKCEICEDDSVLLDKHHIISKSKGGSNKAYNIAHLCPNCHRRVHTGDIILEGRFESTLGNVLVYHLKGDQQFITDRDLPNVHLI